MCCLWSINSSWHRTLKMVGSHSKDPLLSHWASLLNSLWKWASLPRFNLAPNSGCALLFLSSVHSESHGLTHSDTWLRGTCTGSLACPPSYARLGCSHVHTGVIISYGARALPELIKCFSSPSSLLNSQAPLSEPESSTSKRQQREGQSAGPGCWSQCPAINAYWLAHDQASWKGGGGAVSYAYNRPWISPCLEVPG